MASIKGTLTEQNLLKAFAGESQARSRYTFFASQAKKEGFDVFVSDMSAIKDKYKKLLDDHGEEWELAKRNPCY